MMTLPGLLTGAPVLAIIVLATAGQVLSNGEYHLSFGRHHRMPTIRKDANALKT